MIALILYPETGGTRFVELALRDLRQGIDFLLFALENLVQPDGNGLSLAITARGNQPFPSLHFQQVGTRWLFQLYVGDQFEGIDAGWHCLVDRQADHRAEELVSTVWDNPVGSYFAARFADGLLLHESLLVGGEALAGFLAQYTEDFPQWYQQGSWVNLGSV